MIKNEDVSIGINKKVIPKFKSPRAVHEVLRNDRFMVKDNQGFQHSDRA